VAKLVLLSLGLSWTKRRTRWYWATRYKWSWWLTWSDGSAGQYSYLY